MAYGFLVITIAIITINARTPLTIVGYSIKPKNAVLPITIMAIIIPAAGFVLLGWRYCKESRNWWVFLETGRNLH